RRRLARGGRRVLAARRADALAAQRRSRARGAGQPRPVLTRGGSPMRMRWYGQSAFSLEGERSVVIDPFGRMDGLAVRGIEFRYPPIEGVTADLVLVTHEHLDHNAVEVIGGDPAILRATA